MTATAASGAAMPAGRPRLILHIGTHKTASTTLQAVLSETGRRLARQGVLYPRTDREPMPKRRKHAFLSTLLRDGGDGLASLLPALQDELAAAGCHTLLMSEEGLSEPAWLQNTPALAALAAAFELTVICFLRRQDYFLESLWNQRCKNARTCDHIDTFIDAPGVRAHMNFAATLDIWAAHARIIACPFETARRDGVVATFGRLAGLRLPPEDRPRNVSPGMRHAALMAVLNRLGADHDEQQIARILGPDPTRTALGARLRAAVLARHAADNEILASRYGVTFDTTLPEEGPDPLPPATEAEARAYLAALDASGLAQRPRQQHRAALRAGRRAQREAAGRRPKARSEGDPA